MSCIDIGRPAGAYDVLQGCRTSCSGVGHPAVV